jgi:hypothetical protein
MNIKNGKSLKIESLDLTWHKKQNLMFSFNKKGKKCRKLSSFFNLLKKYCQKRGFERNHLIFH